MANKSERQKKMEKIKKNDFWGYILVSFVLKWSRNF
jgi:hypothetical protein